MIIKYKFVIFFGGLNKFMPKLSAFFLIFVLGAIGFPGTSGFVGEYLTLLSAYARNTIIAVVASTGVILAASYMLLLYKNVFLGPVSEKISKKVNDLNIYEISVYILLIILIFIIGIKPNFLLDYTSASIERIIKLYPISIL